MFGSINEFARDTGWLHAPDASASPSTAWCCSRLLLVAGWWLARDRGARTDGGGPVGRRATLLAVAANQPLVTRTTTRPGPTPTTRTSWCSRHRSADDSFPSDHAVMAGAVAAGLWLVDRRLGIVATSPRS